MMSCSYIVHVDSGHEVMSCSYSVDSDHVVMSSVYYTVDSDVLYSS